jgi:hypothetical protein
MGKKCKNAVLFQVEAVAGSGKFGSRSSSKNVEDLP